MHTRTMARHAILLACLLCSACGTAGPRQVVRLDLDEIASDTVMRDTAPGFGNLPSSAPPAAAPAKG